MAAVYACKEVEVSEEEELSAGEKVILPIENLTFAEAPNNVTVDEPSSARPVVDSLRSQLAALGLDTRGRRQELSKRLRRAQKKKESKVAAPDFKNDNHGNDDFTCPWKFDGNDGPSWETQADEELGKQKHHEGYG